MNNTTTQSGDAVKGLLSNEAPAPLFCAWCHSWRVKVSESASVAVAAPGTGVRRSGEAISHGICPECSKRELIAWGTCLTKMDRRLS